MTKVKGKMTVLHFMENRPSSTYGKQIRVLDDTTHKSRGAWFEGENPYKLVKNIKNTEKIVFLMV